MKVLDGMEDTDGLPWEPTTDGAFGDTLPVSLVNKRHPDLYISVLSGPLAHESQPGFVLNATLATSLINCMFALDGGSMGNRCGQLGGGGGCLPGCPWAWCESPWGNYGTTCAWHRSRLFDMMTQQDNLLRWGHEDGAYAGRWNHNEIVLDTFNSPWRDHLPSMILAVFIQPDCTRPNKERGRSMHRDFLQTYGLDEVSAPLLVYNRSAEIAPFSMDWGIG